MSIVRCEHHDKNIDLDVDSEHFYETVNGEYKCWELVTQDELKAEDISIDDPSGLEQDWGRDE